MGLGGAVKAIENIGDLPLVVYYINVITSDCFRSVQFTVPIHFLRITRSRDVLRSERIK